jgi:hypothetical protein
MGIRELGVTMLILPWLISCATKGSMVSAFSPVYVTDRGKFVLRPPSDLEKPLDMAQRISGSYGGAEFIMDAWVRADETRIAMAFFNSLGATMGDLSFSEGTLSFSSSFLPSSVKAEYIVADFQFCFYRPGALSRALKNGGLRLSVESGIRPDGSGAASREEWAGERRTIYEGDKRIIEIEKTASLVRYTNYLRGYAYTLEGAF